MKKYSRKVMMFGVIILTLLLALLLVRCSADRRNDEKMWEMLRTLRAENFHIEEQTVSGETMRLVRIFRRDWDDPESGIWIYFWITRDRHSRVAGIMFYQHGMERIIEESIVTTRYVYISSEHPSLAHDYWGAEVCADTQALYEAFLNGFLYSEAELAALARWYLRTDPFYRNLTL